MTSIPFGGLKPAVLVVGACSGVGAGVEMTSIPFGGLKPEAEAVTQAQTTVTSRNDINPLRGTETSGVSGAAAVGGGM